MENTVVVEEIKQDEEITVEQEPEVPIQTISETSVPLVIGKHGNTIQDEVSVIHHKSAPQKIEIVPSSGYFYPKPKVLFLYR